MENINGYLNKKLNLNKDISTSISEITKEENGKNNIHFLNIFLFIIILNRGSRK